MLLLPAETTYRVSGWLVIAALSALVDPVKPYDALTTFNPSSPACASAAALSELLPVPLSLRILNGITFASGAVPVTPIVLLAAATIPATCVPWPEPSEGTASSSDVVPAGNELQVGMVELGAGVDDTHGDAGAARHAPGGDGRDVVAGGARDVVTAWPVLLMPH